MNRTVRPHFIQSIMLMTQITEDEHHAQWIARVLDTRIRLRLYVSEHALVGREQVFAVRHINVTSKP
jgi:hypothetical protein